MELSKEEIQICFRAVWSEAVNNTRIERNNGLTDLGQRKLRDMRNLLLKLEPESGKQMTVADRAAAGLPAGDAPQYAE